MRKSASGYKYGGVWACKAMSPTHFINNFQFYQVSLFCKINFTRLHNLRIKFVISSPTKKCHRTAFVLKNAKVFSFPSFLTVKIGPESADKQKSEIARRMKVLVSHSSRTPGTL